MASTFRGLLPSGRLPSTAETQVRDLIQTEAPMPDLSDYATKGDLAAVEPTPEAVAQAAGHVLHIGAAPPESDTMYGVPVVWIDTRNPGAWEPAPPVFDLAGKTLTIPDDDGATYMRDGSPVSPGTVSISVPEGGETAVAVTAAPKPGYVFAPGAATSWEVTYEDVLPAYDLAAFADGAPAYYLRLDEDFPAASVRNRGTGSLEVFWGGGGVAGPDLGVGSRSLLSAPNHFFVRNFFTQPLSALTIAAVVHVPAQASGQEAVRIVATPTGTQILGVEFSQSTVRVWGHRLDTLAHYIIPAGNAARTMLVALVWDGAEQTLYVDGEPVDSRPVSTMAVPPGADGRAQIAHAQNSVPIAGVVLDTVARSPQWVQGLAAAVRR